MNNGDDTFSTVAASNLFQGGSYGYYSAFTLDGNYAASFINSTTIQIYHKSGGIFVPYSTLTMPSTSMTEAAPSISFSPNGNYIAVRANCLWGADPYCLAIAQNNGSYTFTLMPSPTQPTYGALTLPSWSSNSQYLAMGANSENGIAIYTVGTPTFIGPVTPSPPTGLVEYGQGYSFELTH